MSKVLVTGGAGFIGSHIASAAINEGHDVVVVDDLSSGSIENIPDRAAFYHMDIRSEQLLDVIADEKIEYVCHAAAQVSVAASLSDPVSDGSINILGTINLLEACRKNHIKRIVYSSSVAVYGNPEYLPLDESHLLNPISAYGISKRVPEIYLKMYAEVYGLEYMILRYANVYGPKQSSIGEGGVVSIFSNNLIEGRHLVVNGDGEQTRDFVFVGDVAEANILAMTEGYNDIVNIGSGKSKTIKELYEALKDISETDLECYYGPERSGDIKHSSIDNIFAKKVLGWVSKVGLREGLRLTLVDLGYFDRAQIEIASEQERS